jgi:hypothetical protein
VEVEEVEVEGWRWRRWRCGVCKILDEEVEILIVPSLREWREFPN